MEFQQIVMADAPDINVGVPRWYTIHNPRALGHSVTADGIEGSLSLRLYRELTLMTRTRLSADVGGTFTDIVLERGAERWTDQGADHARRARAGRADRDRSRLAPCPARRIADVETFVHGTTLATNAIIERRGARTALVATDGFRDVIEIGTESRYDQYELALARPKPLVPRPLRFTVRERIDARGKMLLPLDEADVAAIAGRLRDAAVESVAIAFMHGYVDGTHERRCEALLRDALPGVRFSLVQRGLPRDPRIRAHLHHHRQRLRAAA